VLAYDPKAMANAQLKYGARNDLVLCPKKYEAAAGADALAVLTEWADFRSPDWERLAGLLVGRSVFDGRDLYDPTRLALAGFSRESILTRSCFAADFCAEPIKSPVPLLQPNKG
jgi:UDPglucose 6-dehydrogenase